MGLGLGWVGRLVWCHPLQFGLLVQVGGPVDQVEGPEEQREGYPGNAVDLAHAVEGLLGLGWFGLGLLLGLGGWWGGALGNCGQPRVTGDVGREGSGCGRWVGGGVVLHQQGLLLLLLLPWFRDGGGDGEMRKTAVSLEDFDFDFPSSRRSWKTAPFDEIPDLYIYKIKMFQSENSLQV